MDSSFQHHIGTNYVPSIEETRKIKDFLEKSAKEVHTIDNEINQLQQQLDLLQDKRSKVLDLVEPYRALISPARRLSRDILEEIFLACLPTDRNPCMSSTEAPLLLTRICSSWRSIAHSTPRLWAAIHIVLPTLDTGYYPPANLVSIREGMVRLKLDQRQAAARTWLDRSGSCPLSISLYESPYFATGDTNYDDIISEIRHLYLSLISNTILLHHRHWYELDVYLSSDILGDLLKNGLTEERLKTLRKLHLTNYLSTVWTGDAEVWVQWENIVGLLSRVTSATISGYRVYLADFSSTPQHEQHVWRQLTELNLELETKSSLYLGNTVDRTSTILRHCLALETLKLKLSGAITPSQIDTNSWPPITGDIALQQLTTLYLSLPPSNEIKSLVKRLYLPSIKQFDLDIPGYIPGFMPGFVQEILMTVIRDSRDDLSLGLHSPFWLTSPRDVVQILHDIPHLKSLKFITVDHGTRWSTLPPPIYPVTQSNIFTDDLLSALSPLGKGYSDITCPQLEVLDFDYNLLTDFTGYGIREFVEARRLAHLNDGRIAALRKLRVFVNDFKQKTQPDKKLSLGKDSAVYFRKHTNDSLSPWEGLAVRWGSPYEYDCTVEREIYTEL